MAKKTTKKPQAKIGQDLSSLIGKRVTLFCVNYIYTGLLVSATSSTARLKLAAIVYETGPFTDPAWKDAQPLPHEVLVMVSAIESAMVLK